MGSTESKIGFFGHLEKLVTETISESNSEYWLALWKNPFTSEDVFLYLTPTLVRTLVREKRDNLESLFRVGLQYLETFIGGTKSGTTFITQDIILNILRTVTRITPFIYETCDLVFIHKFFWGQAGEQSFGARLCRALLDLAFLPSFTIVYQHKELEGQDKEPVMEGLEPSLVWNVMERVEEVQMNNCRLEVLRCLLVCSSHTLYIKPEFCKTVRNEFLEKLVHPKTAHSVTLFYSLINVIFTYDPVGWGVPYATYLVGDPVIQVVDSAVQLLSVLLDYIPIPLSAQNKDEKEKKEEAENKEIENKKEEQEKEKKEEEEKEGQVEVKKEEQVEVKKEKQEETEKKEEEKIEKKEEKIEKKEEIVSQNSSTKESECPDFNNKINVFNEALINFSEPAGFTTLLTGFCELLNNVHQSKNTWMPNSMTSITCYQELLIVLLKFLDVNESMLQYMTSQSSIADIVIPILYIMYTSRNNPGRVGLLHLCAFILLRFSSEREFGVQLNQIVPLKLPIDIQTANGTLADFLILVISKIISTHPEGMTPLFENLMTILANVSPYVKSISMPASIKLLALFEQFTSPRFLFAAPQHHHCVFLLVEVFNNIIQYQFAGNTPLVYSLIRRKGLFDRLMSLPERLIEKAKSRQKNVSSEKIDQSALVALGDQEMQLQQQSNHNNNQQDESNTGNTTEREERSRTVSKSSTDEHDKTKQILNNTTSTNTVENLPPQQWKPTILWLEEWIAKLPIHTINSMFTALIARVEQFISEGNVSDERQILNFLSKTTVVGLLPLPHAIILRKCHPYSSNYHWLTTFVWAVIYLNNLSLAIFDGRAIKLFQIATVPAQ